MGISAHLGWAATATIALGRSGPRVLRSDRIEIGEPDDRRIREPYHVAAGFDGLDRVPPPPQPERGLQRCLRAQRRAAAREVGKLAAALAADGYRLAFAGLLVSRGRPSGSFEDAVRSHTQVHIEEGLAVRESLRRALVDAGAQVVGLDQKSVWQEAGVLLGRSEASLQRELKSLRPENDGAWRKEEQSAALAAWMAWTKSAAPRARR